MLINCFFFKNLQFPVITQEVDEEQLLLPDRGVWLSDLKNFLMYLKKFSS